MEGQEFLRLSREMLDIFRKGTDLCYEIQPDIYDRYRKGLISHEQWVKETEENDRKKGLFLGAA